MRRSADKFGPVSVPMGTGAHARSDAMGRNRLRLAASDVLPPFGAARSVNVPQGLRCDGRASLVSFIFGTWFQYLCYASGLPVVNRRNHPWKTMRRAGIGCVVGSVWKRRHHALAEPDHAMMDCQAPAVGTTGRSLVPAGKSGTCVGAREVEAWAGHGPCTTSRQPFPLNANYNSVPQEIAKLARNFKLVPGLVRAFCRDDRCFCLVCRAIHTFSQILTSFFWD